MAVDVVFDDTARLAVRTLLSFIGEDPDRDGLTETPARVVRALREMTCGYHANPADVLGVTFDGAGHDEMVVLDGITFTSMCEHHMLPFTGVAAVGYIPAADGRIVGLSKLARVVDMYARRLQVQERMTDQIARAVLDVLSPEGVGVIVRAQHGCMAHRGVMQPGAWMTTSAMHGSFRDDRATRDEFMRLATHAIG